MPDVLHLKPEEIDTPEKRAQFKVCVVGCGQMGAAYAVTFAEVGFRVTCADADQALLKRLTRGKIAVSEREMESKLKGYVRAGTLNATEDLKGAVAHSDIILLASTAKFDERGNTDFSELESSCRQVGAGLQRGSLVVFGGLAGFGFTEGVVTETLEGVSGFKAGTDFGLAYVQDQTHEGVQATEVVGKRELIVAANEKASLDAASLILSTATKSTVKQIVTVKVAELAALFGIARKNVSKALANEFAVLCEKAEVDVLEVLKLMNSGVLEPDSSPGIGLDGKERGMQLLLESAENLEMKLRLPKLAVQVNEDNVRHTVTLTQSVLRDCGKTLRRTRIVVLGAISEGTLEETFVKMLASKGARINVYNPRGAKSDDSNQLVVSKRSLVEAVESCDCIVILTGEEQFRRLNLKSLRSVMRSPAAVVDLVGLFERKKVEGEGFLYRGLGRGVERK